MRKRFFALPAAILIISISLAGCGASLPVQKDADRVIYVDDSYAWLLTGGTAQEFLRSLDSAGARRVKGPPPHANYSVRLIIAGGFSGPGQVVLYDAAQRLISCDGSTFRLSKELTGPKPQEGVHLFPIGNFGLNAPTNSWAAARAKDKGAVMGLEGLHGGYKVLLVSMGEQATPGYVVDLMNADYSQGTWRLLLQYRRLPEDPAAGVSPVPTFIATFAAAEKVEVYELGEGGGQTKLVGVPIKEEKAQPPTPSNVAELTDICRKLIDEYLRDEKSNPEETRLLDYRIDMVKFDYVWTATGRLTFCVQFSVLPASEKSFNNWIAGNGQLGLDGWILKKTFFVDVQGAGTDYHITGMGTSP